MLLVSAFHSLSHLHFKTDCLFGDKTLTLLTNHIMVSVKMQTWWWPFRKICAHGSEHYFWRLLHCTCSVCRVLLFIQFVAAGFLSGPASYLVMLRLYSKMKIQRNENTERNNVGASFTFCKASKAIRSLSQRYGDRSLPGYKSVSSSVAKLTDLLMLMWQKYSTLMLDCLGGYLERHVLIFFFFFFLIYRLVRLVVKCRSDVGAVPDVIFRFLQLDESKVWTVHLTRKGGY